MKLNFLSSEKLRQIYFLNELVVKHPNYFLIFPLKFNYYAFELYRTYKLKKFPLYKSNIKILEKFETNSFIHSLKNIILPI